MHGGYEDFSRVFEAECSLGHALEAGVFFDLGKGRYENQHVTPQSLDVPDQNTIRFARCEILQQSRSAGPLLKGFVAAKAVVLIELDL